MGFQPLDKHILRRFLYTPNYLFRIKKVMNSHHYFLASHPCINVIALNPSVVQILAQHRHLILI